MEELNAEGYATEPRVSDAASSESSYREGRQCYAIV